MGQIQPTMDIMSDERAWCMFASAVLSCEASIGTTAIDAAKAATVADALLKEFHSRFRSEDEDGEDEDDDDDDDD